MDNGYATSFSKAFQEVLAISCQVVDIEDILLALMEDQSGIFYRTLLKVNVDMNDFKYFLENKKVKTSYSRNRRKSNKNII